MHRLRSTKQLACLAAILVASNAAHAEVINGFGNAVFPTIKASAPGGVPGIADNRGTGGVFPGDVINAQGLFELNEALTNITERVSDQPTPTDPAERQEREQILADIMEIADIFDEKTSGVFGLNGAVAGRQSVNQSETVAGINTVADTLGILNASEVLTSDALSFAVSVVADADPFVTLTGSLTNTSETQAINAFLPLELAFLDPIPLDAPLLRETFVSVELRDTDGDGQASLRAAGLSFQVLATTDVDNPSLGNTDPIGVSERLGLPRLRSPGVEFFRTDEAAPVDNSLFVSQRAQISHATGELVLEQLSPGDTVDFTAILSLGIEGDPLTPLIPAGLLRSFLLGAELAADATAPEPSSGLLAAATAGLCLTRRGRRG